MRRRFDDDERRARLGHRHHLSRPAPSVETATTDLAGLHSSDPATVFLAARARRPSSTIEEIEHALYDARTLVRLLGMRRTMFVVDRHLAGVIDVSCARDLARRERKRLLDMIESAGVAGRRRPDRWLAAVEEATLAALAEHGPAAAAELKAHVPELGLKLTAAEGTTYALEVGVSSRVLGLLAMDGRIVRGRPAGRGSPASTGGPGPRTGWVSPSTTTSSMSPAPRSYAVGSGPSGRRLSPT